MMKKILPLMACLAIAFGIAGCSAPAAPEASDKDAAPEASQPAAQPEAEKVADEGSKVVTAEAAPAAAKVPFPEVSADLLPFEGSEFDEGCLSCHESYDAVAEKTAEYGDSNPHNSIHGRLGSCENCHSGDKVVNEDQKCLSCHAWPREEQSMSH